MSRSIATLEAGKNLSKVDCEKLETELLKEPDNLESRIQIVGFLWKDALKKEHTAENQNGWLKNVCWLIKNYPENDVLYWPEANHFPRANNDTLSLLQALWDECVARHSENVMVLRNAASFYSQIAPEKSLDLVIQALDLSSDSVALQQDYATYLSLVIDKCGNSKLPEKFVSKAKALFEKQPNNIVILRTLLRLKMNESDFEGAKLYAHRLADLKQSDHFTHTALGIILLAEGDINGAKRELVSSTNSATLSGNDYDFALANSLLNLGEKTSVVLYLKKCWKLWPMGRPFLLIWIASILVGGKPRLQRCL